MYEDDGRRWPGKPKGNRGWSEVPPADDWADIEEDLEVEHALAKELEELEEEAEVLERERLRRIASRRRFRRTDASADRS